MPGAAERLAACSAADSPQQAHQFLLGVAPRSASGVLCCGGPAAAGRAVPADAHGGRAGRNWQRLNFPTDGEVKTGERCTTDGGGQSGCGGSGGAARAV